ncbi:MAG: hypothetical protein E6R03_15985 [Hyphomicrobiaceae bacterium]|nr:MAG: hypothetical protein E6R03_15985 [Hyphomicrobiaceae bacterium]
MANEIQVSASLSVQKGYLTARRSQTRSFTLNAASPAKAAGIASIGTAAHEALPMGDVGTAGWAWFENLDSTNYVQIGTDNGGAFIPFLKLMPGEPQLVRLGTNAPYAKANTAAVKLDYEIFED